MTSLAPFNAAPLELEEILNEGRRRTLRRGAAAGAGLALLVGALMASDMFEVHRYADARRAVGTLLVDSIPPDFSRWQSWLRPLLDTIAMSLSGTALGIALAIPLGMMGARNYSAGWLSRAVRLLLNLLRAIPCLIWGIGFVAALGFGPLPGVCALAAHSTGTIGKFCMELIEHVDPAPGDALHSHGVSSLGILRFCVWPQILPRLADLSIYRFEHNVRAATTLGAVGAGGFGLEIVTAFHLFEYREALALILVLLAVVSVLDSASALVRRCFLEGRYS